VIINSNGTVSHPTASPATWGNSAQMSTYYQNECSCVYVGSDTFVYGFYNPGTGYRSLCAVKVNANGTITAGTPVNAITSGVQGPGNIAWDSDNNVGIWEAQSGTTNSYYHKMKQFTVSGTSISMGSQHAPLGTGWNANAGGGKLVYTGNSIFMWFYIRSGLRCRLVQTNSSAPQNAPSTSNYVSLDTTSVNNGTSAVWNSDRNEALVVYSRSTSSGMYMMGCFQHSGWNQNPTITNNVPKIGYTTGFTPYGFDCCYDSTNQSYFMGYHSSNDNKYYAAAANVVNGSLSHGTFTSVMSGSDINSNSQQEWMDYNKTSDLLLITYMSHSYSKERAVTISGTGSQPSFSLGSTASIAGTTYVHSPPGVCSSTDSATWMWLYNTSSSNNAYFLRRSAATSTMSSDKYIGFSDGNYSNGATATIQLPGTVVDSLSGLTTGSKYYVGGDGTPDANDSYSTNTKAGVALSSSTLLLQ
jgi:hypothetical protein